MGTGNFDVLVQLHEKALNKVLAMVFYKGMLRVQGKYEVDSSLPATLKPYTTFDYDIYLENEPFIDFRDEDNVFLRFSASLKMTVLSGIEIKFGVDFYVGSMVKFDLATRKLYFELLDAKIVKIKVQSQYSVSREFLNKINFIIGEIIAKYFRNQIKSIDIPIALVGLELPMMPAGDAYKLPVSKVEVKILNNKVLAAGISFFENKGSLSGMTNLAGEKDCVIALDTNAVYKVIDFWWTNTTYSKKQSFSEDMEIGFAQPIASTVDLATRIISLGFIETETDYENMVLKYGGEVTLDKKPTILFKSGELVDISELEFVADIYANLFADVLKDINLDTSSFIPDSITPWNDDIDIRNINENRQLLALTDIFTLQVEKAAGRVRINEKNNLAVKITNADFKILFNKKGSTFSEHTWDKIMDLLNKKVLDKIPEIIVSPSLVLAEINVYGFSFTLDKTLLDISDTEIDFSSNLLVNELKSNTVAVPNYIGNKEKMTIHHFDCKFVGDIHPENRVGYYVIYEALADHYKACKQCLNSYRIK